jgi:DNA-binding transcriptional regulator YhcF (GntR family)
MLIGIDFESNTPIYTQLHDHIVLGVAKGLLAPGETLPSVRQMASDIGINLHTVHKAYNILKDEGYIVMDRRHGAAIAASFTNRDGFASRLREALLPLAAEAVCHGLGAQDFEAACGAAFHEARGNGK